MKHYAVLHIRSSFASLSLPGDRWLYLELPSQWPVFGVRPKAAIEVTATGEKKTEDLTITYLEDRRFAFGGFLSTSRVENAKTPEFKAHLAEYTNAGWTEEEPGEIVEFYARERRLYWADRKAKGFVLHKEYEELTPADYDGGLSSAVTSHPDFIRYCEAPFGYVGHAVRTYELDELVETAFFDACAIMGHQASALDLFVTWLCSSDGRHRGDSWEGDTLENQRKLVSAQAGQMVTLALAYVDPRHDGTLGATRALVAEMN